MKKLWASLLAMLLLLSAAAMTGTAEDEENTLPDLSFAVSGETVVGWTGAGATDIMTDGASPQGTAYLTIEKRVQIVSTDFIPMQAEPAVFSVFYKSNTASAASVYVQYYAADKSTNLGSSAQTFSEASGTWMKYSVSVQKDGAAYFKIWLRNLKADATVSYASPLIRLQSEGNALLNGDMQEYSEAGGVITLGSWNLTAGTTGGTIVGTRESNGNVYVSMTGGSNGYSTYLQQRVAVVGEAAYRFSFKLRGNLTKPAVQVYLYDTENATLANGYITVSAVGTPAIDAWTEYEAYITTQVGAAAVGYISAFVRNPFASYAADIDDVTLARQKTSVTLSKTGNTVTAKGHIVLGAPVTTEDKPILLVCVYADNALQSVQIVSGEKADISLTANGQFAASTSVTAASGATVKAFAWDSLSSMRALGKAAKQEV